MTKDILINISGLQMDVDPNDPIEMMTTGAYYLRNGKHYILYDELSEDNEIVKNVIKIGPKSVELTRKGGQSSHMVFEEGKENLSYYDTPFGSLLMGVNTSNIDWIEEEEQMHLKVDYDLSMITFFLFSRLTPLSIRTFSDATVVSRSSHKITSNPVRRTKASRKDKVSSPRSPTVLFIFFGRPKTIFSTSYSFTSSSILA